MTTTSTSSISLHAGAARSRARRPAILGLVIAVVAIAVGLIAPLAITQAYWMTVLVDAAIVGLVAVSIGFLYRHLGIISLGQTAFYGTAAYGTAILRVKLDWPLLASAAGGVAIGILLAVVIGVLVMRAKGVAFLMLTMVLGLCMYYIAVMDSMRPITGGYDGLILTPSADQGFLWYSAVQLLNDRVFWPIVWVVLVVLTLVLWFVGRSRFGTVLHGIRENEERMRFSGFGTLLPRFAAFVIAGAVASVAGVLSVLNSGLVTEQSLSFDVASQQLVATIVGGLGAIAGPIVGAFLFTALQSVFSASGGMEFFLGLTLVLVLAFLRGGIVGGIEQAVRAVRRRVRASRRGGD